MSNVTNPDSSGYRRTLFAAGVIQRRASLPVQVWSRQDDCLFRVKDGYIEEMDVHDDGTVKGYTWSRATRVPVDVVSEIAALLALDYSPAEITERAA